jgi:hypothetical protein
MLSNTSDMNEERKKQHHEQASVYDRDNSIDSTNLLSRYNQRNNRVFNRSHLDVTVQSSRAMFIRGDSGSLDRSILNKFGHENT